MKTKTLHVYAKSHHGSNSPDFVCQAKCELHLAKFYRQVSAIVQFLKGSLLEYEVSRGKDGGGTAWVRPRRI
jgi:hypothetical protein